MSSVVGVVMEEEDVGCCGKILGIRVLHTSSICVGIQVLHVWEYEFYMCGNTSSTCVGIRVLHVWEYEFHMCGNTSSTCVGLRVLLVGIRYLQK
jgi:hypothetical protein